MSRKLFAPVILFFFEVGATLSFIEVGDSVLIYR